MFAFFFSLLMPDGGRPLVEGMTLLRPMAHLQMLAANPQPADVPVPIDSFVAALRSHAYALAAAIGIGFVVSLTKTGWLSTWLAERIPATARPWVAVVLGAVSFTCGAIIAGTDWRTAVMQGIEAGVLAVFGHQVVVQGLRKGAELLPQTAKLTAAHGPPVTVEPPPPIAARPPSVRPPPAPPPAA